MDFHLYLIAGAYTFTLASWAWLWVELKNSRSERIDQIDELKNLMEQLLKSFARHEGISEGQGHEARIARLERAMLGGSEGRSAGGNGS